MKKNHFDNCNGRHHHWRLAGVAACVIWITAVLLTGCSGCEPDDDEQLIRLLVSQAVERAEMHNIADLFDLAIKSFVADPGSHDRRSSKAMLLVMFRRYGSFRILHPSYGVNISEDAKSAELSIPFLIVREGQPVPEMRELAEDPARWLKKASEAADPFMLDAQLIKTDGEWKVEKVHITGRRSVGI